MEMAADKERWATERAGLVRREQLAEAKVKSILEEKELLKASLQVR